MKEKENLNLRLLSFKTSLKFTSIWSLIILYACVDMEFVLGTLGISYEEFQKVDFEGVRDVKIIFYHSFLL